MRLIFLIFASLALLAAAIFDIKNKKVPNKYICLIMIISILLLFLGITMYFIDSNELLISVWKSLCIVFITFGMAFLVGKIRHVGVLGAGDVKIAFVLCLIYNMDDMIFFIAFMLVFSGAWYIVMTGFNKMEKRERFPLVPFMFLGSLVVLFSRGVLV